MAATSPSTEVVDFSAGSIETHLVGGCIREAERSEIVALRLDALRSLLAESFHAHLFSLAEEMRQGAFILRDVADKSQVYSGRVPIVLNYLNIVLPCLSRTLRDITAYYEDRTMSKEIRWRTMYHKMSAEAQGMTLSQRFHLYNQFLTQLRSMLVKYVRSPGPGPLYREREECVTNC